MEDFEIKPEPMAAGDVNDVAPPPVDDGALEDAIKSPEAEDAASPVVDKSAGEGDAVTSSKDEEPQEEEQVKNGDNALPLLLGYFESLENRLPSCVLDLIYWRQPLRSGAVFSSIFLVLCAFSLFSAITVVSYVALFCLGTTLFFVAFRKIAAAVQKTGDGHPLQAYLDEDLGALLSAEDVNGVITSILQSLVRYIELLRNLLLITDIFESLKFAVALYAVTYVGDMFNLLTIFIILHVALFTIPKTYEVYGAEIDMVAEKLIAHVRAQWPVIKEQIVDRVMMIKEKAFASVPIGKEKSS